jgi:hypothetical protein
MIGGLMARIFCIGLGEVNYLSGLRFGGKIPDRKRDYALYKQGICFIRR